VNSIREWNYGLKLIFLINGILIFLDSIITFYAINFLGFNEANEYALIFMSVFGNNLGLIVADVLLWGLLFLAYKRAIYTMKKIPNPLLYVGLLIFFSFPASKRLITVYNNILLICPEL